ncbi:sigma-E processing peptidase SpoIIGA [Paenibacillus arenilitoris]|uniref:Sporulation sigma-E factor-processing peptidase n=1 Tax=Paenibacillus arenilitoris TaxID=2772299 RepID=A0A927CMG5_9BACL|nr:sigma-E processing peptidase SpoIIGA [Paenibacillus arenilitoris]MBD2870120.1 sigma-E processing peptidase SpoIIGA [Paenibacillus arenilitoris]
MAVYVDVMFLRELLIDGAILLTSAWARHLKPPPWRVLLASSVGACYVVLMLFPQLSFLFTLAVKIAMSLLMVWIAFGFTSIQHYLRNIGAFYAVNFVAAGAVLGLYYLFMQGSGEVWRTITFANGSMRVELKMGLFYFIAAFCIGLYVYRSVLTQKRERELVRAHLAEVKIRIGEKIQTCTGLIDTGNQLYDPLTRTPVMVTEAALWQEDLPESWLSSIRSAQVDRLVAGMDEQPFAWQDRLRLVPFRGVNRGSQFMLALKPDSVEITQEGRVYETRKVLIGLDGGKLASDGAYRAIIHPSMVQQQT